MKREHYQGRIQGGGGGRGAVAPPWTVRNLWRPKGRHISGHKSTKKRHSGRFGFRHTIFKIPISEFSQVAVSAQLFF